MKKDKTKENEDSKKLIQQLKASNKELIKINEKLKASEEEIKINEKKYRDITENIKDIIVCISPSGKILYVSKAIENFAGYIPEEEIGKHISKYIANKTDLLKALKLLAEVLITKESGRFEFMLKTKSKKTIWIEHTYVPIIKSGKVTEIQMVLRNNTERKITEEKLKKSNQLLKKKEKEINEYAKTLNKKVKELSCLYGINESIRIRSSIDKILQDTVELIPKGILYLSIAHAVIKINNKEYRSHSFLKTKWKISADIIVKNKTIGLIEVYYIEEFPEQDKTNLINNEIKLLNSIAKIIGEAITHKQTEDEITKYRISSDKAMHGNAIVSLEGNISYINNYFAQAHGYAPQELIGKNLSVFHTKKQMTEVNKLNKIAEKEGSFSPVEVWHVHKDGTEFPMLMSVILIRDSNGNPLHLAASAIDITEQKEKEKEYTKLNAAFKQSPYIINITDKKGIIEYVNPKFSKITGYSIEESIGKNVTFLESGDLPSKIYEDLWKIISSGKEWHGEFHNKKKNGDTYWEKASISPVFNEQKEVISYIKMAEDITEKKRTQKIKDVIFNISNAVFKTNNLEDFINVVREELRVLINTENFYLSLYDEKTKSFSLIFHRDGNDEPNYISAVNTLSSYVIKTKKPLLATKNNKNKLIKSGNINLIDAHSKIWLGVPLFKNNKISGVVSVQSYNDEEAYDKNDLKTLQDIASQLNIYIEHKKDWDKLKLELKESIAEKK